MIRIEERSHEKLAGVNSLFLSFTPTQDIVNIVKSTQVYNFNGKTKEWEVLVSSLAYLLDNLVYFDDIDLKVMEEKSYDDDVKLVVEPKNKPFKHQVEAVKYGLSKNHEKWLLLDSPGLGKTMSMIMLAEELREQRGLEHCLIICGIATLRSNWEREIQKHSHLDSVVIGKKINSKGHINWATMKERAEQLVNKIDEFFVIINIESLRDNQIIDAINNSENNFDMILFDEAHKAKGYNSAQGENLLKLTSKYMTAMTGTLILNSPVDAYVPLAWIGKESKRNVGRFKKTYCTFDSTTLGKITGFKNLDLLKDEIESCSLRRTKDLLDLPEKTVINEYVDMGDSHAKFYNDVKNGVKDEVNKVKLNPNNLLAMVTRLRQATSCPSALTTKNIVSSKAERCCDLVDEIVSQGDKVVVMSVFKETVYALRDMLSQYNPLVCTGDVKQEDIDKNIVMFQEDDEHKVFICTEDKMGTGVTLSRASYMIIMDTPWTYGLLEQVEDRIHRLDSKKPVFIYRLICLDTFDMAVSKIVERKEALGDFIIDDKLGEKAFDILSQCVKDLK